MILYINGCIMQIVGLLMLIPTVVGVYYWDDGLLPLLGVATGAILVGTLIRLWRPENTRIRAREGFVITAMVWVILSLVGALPFIISGEIPKFTDAVFETASGFTTTGASILTDVEAMSKSLLLWRSFTHWIGGMGVLVFLIVFLPSSADEMNLMKAESPGPSVDKLVPKARRTAFLLYAIYTTMTLVQMIILYILGMPKFDAICISFGTAGTGGFGVRGDSCAGYSPACQIVITVFMVLFGVNFKVYFLMIMKKWKDILKCEEVFWYLVIYGACVAMVCFGIMSDIGSLAVSLRTSTFQVASVMTTTGFATTDFNLWKSMPKAVMVSVMFCGACAGSTGGGMKVSRFVIWAKQVRREISKFVHPRSVKRVRLDGKSVEEDVIRSTNVYMMAYLFVFMGSLLLISMDGMDMTSSFTSVTATINNIGPGLGVVGPAGNFAGFSGLSKWVFVLDMIAGRLELFPMLVMISPGTWRRK